MLAAALLFSTLLTISCGKSEIRKSKYGNEDNQTEKFCTDFFTDSNLPYTKLKPSDVENTPDEYLFYIPGGIVFRTLNDYDVVITQRSNLNEAEEAKERNYSGELYALFGEDSVDRLKMAASEDYALLTLPATIPDWESNTVIAAFMEYTGHYGN